jgi:hypothetical protein
LKLNPYQMVLHRPVETTGLFGNYERRTPILGDFLFRSFKSSGLGGGIGLHWVAGFVGNR